MSPALRAMATVTEVAALRRAIAAFRAAGERVAFVPTMGALHEGHLSLVRRAAAAAERVVASIFVNPTQFGPGEDLERYPRTPERDAELLAVAGCDLLFLPAVDAIYPPGHATRIVVGGPARGLEGARRPGHFAGVATVVCQLFHLVAPDVAVFGEKDAQQLAVVRCLVRDLHLPVEILAAPTAREPDGLALSSRNAYLTPPERRAATVLYRALQRAAEAVAGGERRSAALRRLVRRTVAAEPRVELDYVAVVDAATFRAIPTLTGRCVVPLAARVGATRLIDNLQLDLTASGGAG